MARHTERFDRGSEEVPYDPDEPLVVRRMSWPLETQLRRSWWSLLVVLRDAEVDLESTAMSVGWQVRDWLPYCGRARPA